MLNYLLTFCDQWTSEIYLTVVAKNKKEADKIADRLQSEIHKPIINVKLLND